MRFSGCLFATFALALCASCSVEYPDIVYVACASNGKATLTARAKDFARANSMSFVDRSKERTDWLREELTADEMEQFILPTTYIELENKEISVSLGSLQAPKGKILVSAFYKNGLNPSLGKGHVLRLLEDFDKAEINSKDPDFSLVDCIQ